MDLERVSKDLFSYGTNLLHLDLYLQNNVLSSNVHRASKIMEELITPLMLVINDHRHKISDAIHTIFQY